MKKILFVFALCGAVFISQGAANFGFYGVGIRNIITPQKEPEIEQRELDKIIQAREQSQNKQEYDLENQREIDNRIKQFFGIYPHVKILGEEEPIKAKDPRIQALRDSKKKLKDKIAIEERKIAAAEKFLKAKLEQKQLDLVPMSFSTGASMNCYFLQQPKAEEKDYFAQVKNSQIFFPAVIITPSGAFNFISTSENLPVIAAFVARGFSACVLNYSLGERSFYPMPLAEISGAVFELRHHAKIYHINPQQIALVGFGAGSFVAALSASKWDLAELSQFMGVDSALLRPNAIVLGYGAANLDFLDEQSAAKAGKIIKDRDKNLDIASTLKANTPPLFLWNYKENPLVPVNQTLLLANTAQKLNAPYEVHIFSAQNYSNKSEFSENTDFAEYFSDNNPWFMMVIKWLKYTLKSPNL